MMGKKSAFTESSSLSSETEEEFSLETSDLINQRPSSSRWSFFAQIIKVGEKLGHKPKFTGRLVVSQT